MIEYGRNHAVELTSIFVQVSNFDPHSATENLRNIRVIQDDRNKTAAAIDPFDGRGVQLLTHPRLVYAVLRDHDDHCVRLLESLFKDLVDEAISWVDLPFVHPCIDAPFAQALGERAYETSLVFAGVTDESFRCSRCTVGRCYSLSFF